MVNRVIVSGATGFIGRVLCRAIHRDYEIIALSRDAERAAETIGDYASVVEWDSRSAGVWAGQVEGAYAVVHLAGENIGAGRWTQARTDRIRTLGQVLGKPAWTVVPAFLLRLSLGRMADEVLLTSQRAIPKRLMESGFTFKHPQLRTALEAILNG